MAGSWGHVVNKDGTPYQGEYGMADLLENGGDVNEAVEEMYGMIWYLASVAARYQAEATINPDGRTHRERARRIIETARATYRDGVQLGKGGG